MRVYLCIRVYRCVYNCVYFLGSTRVAFAEDPDSSSLCTRYTGDSMTDIRDDPGIRTGSCSADPTVIRIRNRAILCECLHYLFILFVHFIVLFHVDI